MLLLAFGATSALAQTPAEDIGSGGASAGETQAAPEAPATAPAPVADERADDSQPGNAAAADEPAGARGAPATAQSAPAAVGAPERLAVEGVVVAFPDESVLSAEHGSAASHGDGDSGDDLWLVTPEDQFLPLGDAVAVAGVSPGDQISAQAMVSETARAAIVAVAASDASFGASDMVAIVGDSARSEDDTVDLVDVEVVGGTTPPAAGAGPSHRFDIVYLGPSNLRPTAASLTNTVQRALDFWVEQTGGMVTGVPEAPVFVEARNGMCDPYEAWPLAAAQSGRSYYQYMIGGYPGRHLVVFTQGCSGGLASLGLLNSGGAAWVGVNSTMDRHLHVTAHEIGHNLGLDHGYARDCQGTSVDDIWSRVGKDTWLSGSVCRDVSYADIFNVMGGSSGVGLSSLPITQRHLLLGANAESYITGAVWAPGTSRTVTLNALASNSGVRGLRIQGRTADEVVYVEYREPVGSDAGLRSWTTGVGSSVMKPGVRVLKAAQSSTSPAYYNSFMSTALGQVKNGARDFSFVAGDQLALFDERVRITVLAAGGGSAQVKVDFSDRFRQVSAPTLDSVPTVGSAVTVNTGAWDPAPQFSYAWSLDGTRVTSATGASYTPTAADAGKLLSVTVTAALAGYPAVTQVSAAVGVTPTTLASTRLAGLDRFATAVEISKSEFTDPAAVGTVVLVNGLGFADALSAAPLAAKLGGPLLLTQQEVLTESTRLEIERLNPNRVILVGGESAISRAVEDSLKLRYVVERISGADRFDTSLRIAERWLPGSAGAAFVATGREFPDALAAGAAAAGRGLPVILVDGTTSTLPTAVRQRLSAIGVGTVYIAGGTGSVSAGIEQSLRTAQLSVERFAGVDRFDTAALIADRFGYQGNAVYIASGVNFPDALAGTAVAGKQQAALLLSRQECLVPSAARVIARLEPNRVTLLGGTPALAEAVGSYTICK